ncbi:MAG TPA: PAS domain S-box protein, partial [Armatimonadota bacterium]
MEPLTRVQTWLYDELPVGVAILDGQRVFRYVNASFAALQGYSAAQLLNRALVPERSEWEGLLVELIARAADTRHPVERFGVSLRYPRQPFLQRSWDVTVLPLFTMDSLDGVVIYLVDATGRKQSAELRVSESRLRSVLDVAADAILVIDEEGILQEANPAASRIFGYRRDELVGQPVTMIMPSSFAEEHGRFLERYLRTGIVHIIGTIREVEGRRKDGANFACELSIGESREPMGGRNFVGIIRDITDRKRLEAELEDARARLEAILKTVPIPLFVIEPDGHITLYNDAARDFYGE